MITYIPLLSHGIMLTLMAWLTCAIISLTIGFSMGILCYRPLTTPWRSFLCSGYTFIAKGIPAYVQILIAYFIIPAMLGFHVSGFLAGSLALGFCSSGYVTEMIRSAMNSIDQGQWDAAMVLGYSKRAAVTRIILPQALPVIKPALLGELEQLLKSTSLLSMIGVVELTRAGMNIFSRELEAVPIYSLIAGIYLFFSAVLKISTYYVYKERKL